MAIPITAPSVFSATILWQFPTSQLTGTAAAASIGLINTIGVSGNFVGPYLMGWLKDATGSFRPGMFMIAIRMARAGVLAPAMRGKVPLTSAEPTPRAVPVTATPATEEG